jgi:hypothetical protein
MIIQSPVNHLQNELDSLLQIPASQFTPENQLHLENLFNYCTEGAEMDSQKLIVSLIIKAYNRRIQSESISNHIYLNKSETPQIELFRILIEKFPFVKYSQQIVNQAILEAIGNNEAVTLVDIGIGQGVQMLNLLEQAKSLPNLKFVRVIGIEPFADALLATEYKMQAFGLQAPFQLEFTGICDFAENVDFTQFKNTYRPVIINASLALHHIQSSEARNQTLCSIRALNPLSLLMIEPNVNHVEPNYLLRSRNCYNHYYNLFKVIDLLEISIEDKNALKLFFGREINDVLGNEDAHRFERHEQASVWIQRLKENGFSNNSNLLTIPTSGEYGVTIHHHPEGFLGFTFEQETILSVLYAQSI